MKVWDAFISHASEDKNEVARPLAKSLEERGFKIWLDEIQLTVGDSLRRSIDEGLSKSRWGIVILSPDFFAKKWPQSELDGLIAREADGQKVILPVWHRVSAKEVIDKSPLLAAKLAADTSQGIENISQALAHAMLRNAETASIVQEQNVAKTSTLHDLLNSLSNSPSILERMDIEQYHLRKFVGSGGTGAVYRAINIPTGRTVCVKVFFSLQPDYQAITKATERGVRGLASLRHPGVVAVLDFGYLVESDGITPYIVYEFINGVSLYEWSQDIGKDKIALERRLAVATKIASALSVAHDCTFVGNLGFQEKGVLHGDIKPSNILVTNNDQPVILDFMMPDLQRLAKEERQSDKRYFCWKRGKNGRYYYEVPTTGLYGTPGFMAPEQEADGIVLPQSDVYSLGKTFRYLFWPDSDFDLPFMSNMSGVNDDEIFNTMVKIGRIEPSYRDVLALVNRMTKIEPEKRLQSMNMVVNELQKI